MHLAILLDRREIRHFSGRHRRTPRHRSAGIIRPTAALAGFKEVKSESCSVASNSLQPHGLYSPWNSPGQNTGVGILSLLQGVFPTQESNPGLLHHRQILYRLRHQGSAYACSCFEPLLTLRGKKKMKDSQLILILKNEGFSAQPRVNQVYD